MDRLRLRKILKRTPKKAAAYELGKAYIDKYASGQSDRSASINMIISNKIKANHKKSTEKI
jgi:hypothetical protein